MTVQDWMAIVYPLVTAALFIYCCLLILYYQTIRPIRLLIAGGLFHGCELATMSLLSLVASDDSLFGIDTLRPYITLTRFLMLPCLGWMIIEMVRLLRGSAKEKQL